MGFGETIDRGNDSDFQVEPSGWMGLGEGHLVKCVQDWIELRKGLVDLGNIGGGELKSLRTKFIGLSWEKDLKGCQEIGQCGLVRAV